MVSNTTLSVCSDGGEWEVLNVVYTSLWWFRNSSAVKSLMRKRDLWYDVLIYPQGENDRSVIKCYCGFMLYFFQSFSVCNITDNIIAFYRSSPLTTLMSLHSIWSGYIYIFTPHWYNHCCIIIMAGVSRCDCVTIVLLVLLLLWFLLLLSVLLINKCAGLWVRLWLESAVIISAKGQ